MAGSRPVGVAVRLDTAGLNNTVMPPASNEVDFCAHMAIKVQMNKCNMRCESRVAVPTPSVVEQISDSSETANAPQSRGAFAFASALDT